MFRIDWVDFYTGKWFTEVVDSYHHARRMASELRQLGVKILIITGESE